jgi:hypothetical protein
VNVEEFSDLGKSRELGELRDGGHGGVPFQDGTVGGCPPY